MSCQKISPWWLLKILFPAYLKNQHLAEVSLDLLPPVQPPALCVENQTPGRRARGSKKHPERVRRGKKAVSLPQQTASMCSSFLFPLYSTSHLAATVVWLLRLLKIRSKTFSVHTSLSSLLFVCSLKQRDSTPQLWMCLWSVAYMLKPTLLFFSFSVFVCLFFPINLIRKKKIGLSISKLLLSRKR